MSKVVKRDYELRGKEINLKEYYLTIKKRFWLILIVTVIFTLAGYFYSSQNKVVLLYENHRDIIIGSESPDMNTLMVMIKDPIIMNKVKEDLNLSKQLSEIASQIEVEQVNESRVVRITVIDQEPKMAAAIANATANAYESEIVNITGFKDVQLLSEAKVNPIPINGSKDRTVIIAIVFGLIVSIGLAFLLDSLDGSIEDDRDVEEILGVPILGVISDMNRKKVTTKNSNVLVLESRGKSVEADKRKAEGNQ
ncbi:YveK family protein [Virgibacillus sp. DJP39]|uniref:YveK family protein n=1 Tax=Virgibacillus sp. DJP39 TaxID=3409790 RepID=UPI003BB769D2